MQSICDICNTQFSHKQYQKRCSRKCSRFAQTRQNKVYYALNPKHHLDMHRAWRQKNLDKIQQQGIEYRDGIKNLVLSFYGKDNIAVCVWPDCGVSDIDMLSLDHINNDGAKDRRNRNRSGVSLYSRLKREGFPSGFQTLCHNHQWKKQISLLRSQRNLRMAQNHPGFKSAQKSIAKKQGISSERAGAILASGARHASKAARKANPRLARVKGKLHDGGLVKESGLYSLQAGETVVPIMKQHDSEMFSSEGSHPHKNNPCVYEQRSDERKRLKVDEMSGKETDHIFGHTYRIDNQILADSPELLRRRNSRNRDYRTGNRITNNGIYASPISPSEKE